MTARNYAILYIGKGSSSSSGASIMGGDAVLDTEQHALDGMEHTPATLTDRLLATETRSGLLPPITGDAGDVLLGDLSWGPIATGAFLGTTDGEGHVFHTYAPGATLVIDLSVANWFIVQLSEPCAISFANAPASGIGGVWTIQTLGDYAVTWSGEVYWRAADGSQTSTPPDVSGVSNVYTITTLDGGVSIGAVVDNGDGGGGGASASDTAGWIPILDGATGAVLQDGATGQAVMGFGPF